MYLTLNVSKRDLEEIADNVANELQDYINDEILNDSEPIEYYAKAKLNNGFVEFEFIPIIDAYEEYERIKDFAKNIEEMISINLYDANVAKLKIEDDGQINFLIYDVDLINYVKENYDLNTISIEELYYLD